MLATYPAPAVRIRSYKAAPKANLDNVPCAVDGTVGPLGSCTCWTSTPEPRRSTFLREVTTWLNDVVGTHPAFAR